MVKRYEAVRRDGRSQSMRELEETDPADPARTRPNVSFLTACLAESIRKQLRGLLLEALV
jgi:hypothetical protein